MSLKQFSLDGLRTFEVASRYLSFTKAADELCLTRSAVSQQISQLERQIGVRLFVRMNSKLVLTREGFALSNALRKSLLHIEGVVDSIRSNEVSGKLVIGSLPSFGAKWLAPRLKGFVDLHPAVDVTLLSYVGLDDVMVHGVDIAISFARDRQSGIFQEILLQDEVWPICAPSIIQADRSISNVEDLVNYPILHTTLEARDFGVSWDDWLAALNLPTPPTTQMLHFSRAYMMIEAAAMGQGVGIAMRSLVDEEVRHGRLTRLFDYKVLADKSIAVLYPEASQDRPAIRAFSNWIRDCLRCQMGHG